MPYQGGGPFGVSLVSELRALQRQSPEAVRPEDRVKLCVCGVEGGEIVSSRHQAEISAAVDFLMFVYLLHIVSRHICPCEPHILRITGF